MPCFCAQHDGAHVHYKTRQRCARRVQQGVDLGDVSIRNSAHSEEDEPMVCRWDHFLLEDEIDALCLELFANHVDSNSTEDSVTSNLMAITKHMGNFLPERLRGRIPSTFKQLRAMFTPYMTRLIRLAVCPGECRILNDVKPTINYKCWCDGNTNVAWR